MEGISHGKINIEMWRGKIQFTDNSTEYYSVPIWFKPFRFIYYIPGRTKPGFQQLRKKGQWSIFPYRVNRCRADMSILP